ncbi:zinc finger protein 276 isoform X2 [Hippocampus zosterae]|uniref:zinc finger protein 276 isoform X2 n=1 Tax=Hippocampus zosterae TaxID=109293 RepID=UPI00223E62E3|nr:zinc finger protein 276 isoform X2 [Hippocampus zosterae]
MKKKSRSLKSFELSQHSRRACEGKRPCGSRRKTQRISHVTAVTSDLRHRDDTTDSTYTLTDKHKHSDDKAKSSRISTDICRLCHGKFSPRSLLPAFNKWPQDFPDIVNDETYAVEASPPVFHVDFQQLVGVQLDPDPRLSEFVCKKCHSEFYKCHNILVRFLQMVNHLPLGKDNSNRHYPMFSDSLINDGSTTSQTLSSDTACLHNLVSWAHHHGEACKSCPDLKEVLEGQCWGSVKAVWCCVAGHSYTIDTQSTTSARFGHVLNSGESGNGARNISGEVDCDGRSTAVTAICKQTKPGVTPLIQSSALADWTCSTQEFAEPEDAVSPAEEQQDDKQADCDLFHRATGPKKQRHIPNTSEERKIKKKPGPKPGWKRKFKPKGEELPNIYKCLYQGCIAVYRAPDGLKHVKEHHEEVKERPCPHPGCNKVFTIDRYLQRHVKLIHTEERNYICDQCGQTFKQRKHLLVHQMRHSGVKPLQCEICGFQCRQRASLKYHMTKHKAEADLEFACLICSKRFEKAHNLNVHMSMVHPLTQTKVQKGGNQHKPHTAFSSH